MCDGDLNLDYKVNSVFFFLQKIILAPPDRLKDGVLELTLFLVTLVLAKCLLSIEATKVIHLGITQVKDGCSKN